MSEPYLIVGLGNPGRDHAKNRHNVGFMILDQLSEFLGARFSRVQSNALVAEKIYQKQKLILAKPQTYMNLSGKAVRGLTRFFKPPMENIIIAHDDLDLPLGCIRLRPGGGSGGQKGITSILEYLGTPDFTRIKLGIGRPTGYMSASDFVLQDFSDQEIEIINDAIPLCVQAIYEWFCNGLVSAMNKFNGNKVD